MPLESCMLVLDNSEYMRNGDYVPTRFQAQAQAVSTVFTAKTDSNPESAVGLMTMAGKSPSLLVTPTNDIGKLLSALSKSTIGGTSDLATAVQIAQLALKHRENKNQKQRIVVFVGSPLEDSQDSLVKLGKKLRKNNVLVDVVTFGEEGMGNDEKLNALIEAVGGESADSHLVSVPPGPLLLADAIISSPILFQGGTGGEGGAEGMGGFAGADGIDPNMDPELAMAIRMSLAEAEQAAGRSAEPQAGPSSSTTAQPAGEASTTNAAAVPSTLTQPLTNAMDSDIPMASGDVPPNPQSAAVATGGVGTEQDLLGDDEDEDEDEMLRRAMALSRGEDPSEDVTMADVEGDDDEEDEETAIARAIAMSLEEGKKGEDKEAK